MSLRHGTRGGNVPIWKLRRWLPTVLAVAAGVGGPVNWVLAQPPTAKVPAAPPKTEAPPEKTVSVLFDGAPWGDVLDWYAKETGLVLVTTVKPTGSVTIKPPNQRKYTIGEVTDLINEALMSQKFLLIRFNATFIIHPADEKINPTLFQPVLASELPKLGKTEIVLCTVGPLKTLSASDLAPEVEKMLTPFGKVILLDKQNAFQIVDTAGNIRRIIELVSGGDTGDAEVLSYKCQYRKAREIADHLKNLLKDKETTVDATASGQPVFQNTGFGSFGGGPGFGAGGGGFGGFGGPGAPGRGRGPDAAMAAGVAGGGGFGSRTKTVQIQVDDPTNTVMVTAPPDKLGQARKIIEESDKPLKPNDKPIVILPPILKTYTVPNGTAADLAKALTEKFPSAKVSPIPMSNQIMVLAAPDEHEQIVNIINGGEGTPGTPGVTNTGPVQEILPINVSDPKDVAATLTKALGSPNGGPIIEAQASGIFFRGTPAQLKDAKAIVAAFEGPATGEIDGKTLRFNVEGGSAGILAEVLSNAMRGLGKNPVVIQNLTGGSPVEAKPVQPVLRPNPTPVTPAAPPMRPPQPLPGEPRSSLPAGPRDPRFVLAQIVDPAVQNPQKPVIIRVIGNQLNIECDDPEALKLIRDVLRLYTRGGTKADENLFVVIRLKYVGAEEAAKCITEIFNGPQLQQQGGQGGGGGRGGGGGGLFGGGGGGGPLGLLGGLLGGGAAPAGPPAPGRVRVVGEKSSNALIVVKASPLDLLTIRKLLSNLIDSGDTDSEAIQRTFVIQVRNTDVSDMAQTVKDVYKPLLTASGGQTGPALPFPFGNPQQGNATAAKPPALTVATDERTNSLIVLCTETLAKEVKLLVEQLDTSTATGGTEVVKVVRINGFDPAMVQQFVNALQGRDTVTPQQQRGGFGGGGLGGGGLGGGGFPGGGGLGGLGGGGFGGPGGFGGGGFGGLGGGGFGGPGGGRGGGGFGGGGLGGGGGMGGGGGGRGGGGGGRGGGGRQANLGGTTEGPRNFDYRGMEAPSALSTIYDPETDPAPWAVALNDLPAVGTRNRLDKDIIVPVGGQYPAPEGQPPFGLGPAAGPPTPMRPPIPLPGQAGSGPGPETLTDFGAAAPRNTVTAVPFTDLGVVVVRAGDARDLQIVLNLIETLRRETQDKLQPELRVVPLKHMDCNTVAGSLNQIFQRVVLGGGGPIVPPSARSTNPLAQIQGPGVQQNVFIFALPRSNSLLIAGPRGRFDDILKEVERLDQDNTVKPKHIKLKRQSAQVIAGMLQQLYSQKFPGEGTPNTQVRINYDLASNSIIVQASPTDMADIEEFIRQIDSETSGATSEVKLYRLRNALADELASVLIQALTSNVVNPITQSTQPWFIQGVSGPTSGLGALAALGLPGGGALGGQGALAGLGAAQNRPAAQAGGQPGGGIGGNTGGGVSTTAVVPTVGTSAGGGLSTKTSSLRFYYRDGQVIETGYLADVHIIPITRTNGLIVTAPSETIKLIDKLIESLDTVAAASSFVNIYPLRKADATLTAILIGQMFTGANRTSLTPSGTGGTGATGGTTGGTLGAAGTTGIRPLLTLDGNPSAGATLIDLRISVDDRTNSIIVAGSQNDLLTIGAIIDKLEGTPTQPRINDVYKLRNAAAADVQTALQTFMTNALTAYTTAGFGTTYQQILRNVVIVAEPVSNTLLISATPEYFVELKRIIERIDSQPPQVMIQVLIAEVQLNNDREFGVEYGLQSPLIFGRSLSGTSPGTPGFNFNTTTGLPNTTNFQQGSVGFQGLNNLGVGTTSTNGLGVGGFVFQVQSQSVQVLIRALTAQSRIDILSRPQVTILDNQTGYVQVGQDYPYLSASTLTATGAAQQSVTYRSIGVTMRVTPRVNPDGKVLMRVEPNISSVAANAVNLGSGISQPAFNVETVETTVLASDGETIVLGGLISRQDSRAENAIPFFKDIPYIGSLFRYRSQQVAKREVLIIMTPHIIRNEYGNARILAEEIRRTGFCMPDVKKIHEHGMEVMEPALKGANPVPTPGASLSVPNEYIPGGFGGGPGDEGPPNPPSAYIPPRYGPPGSVPPGYVIPPGYVPPGYVPPGYVPPGGAVPPGYVPQGAGLPGTQCAPFPGSSGPLQGGPGAIQPLPIPTPLPGQPGTSPGNAPVTLPDGAQSSTGSSLSPTGVVVATGMMSASLPPIPATPGVTPPPAGIPYGISPAGGGSGPVAVPVPIPAGYTMMMPGAVPYVPVPPAAPKATGTANRGFEMSIPVPTTPNPGPTAATSDGKNPSKPQPKVKEDNPWSKDKFNVNE